MSTCAWSSRREPTRPASAWTYLGRSDLDVHAFQALPLYIRTRVLREGRVLLVKDEDALYELAVRTTKAFADFEPRYRIYLEEVLAGP